MVLELVNLVSYVPSPSIRDMEQSGTILSIGESPLPLGVALKVSSDPTAKKD